MKLIVSSFPQATSFISSGRSKYQFIYLLKGGKQACVMRSGNIKSVTSEWKKNSENVELDRNVPCKRNNTLGRVLTWISSYWCENRDSSLPRVLNIPHAWRCFIRYTHLNGCCTFYIRFGYTNPCSIKSCEEDTCTAAADSLFMMLRITVRASVIHFAKIIIG